MSSFAIVPLDGRDRSGFRCGTGALDSYFQRQAGQDVRRRISACHLLIEKATGTIAGFYTVSAAGIAREDLPSGAAKRLPRYPVLPAALLGRLAIDLRYQGQRLGNAMLYDAVERAAKSDIAIYAMIVDAKDAAAEAFYLHHNFQRYGSVPGKLVALMDELIVR